MRYTVLSALAIATLLFGCVSEKDASDVILLLDQSTYTVTEGDLVRFGIETWTINDRLDRLEISSYDRVNGKSELDTIQSVMLENTCTGLPKRIPTASLSNLLLYHTTILPTRHRFILT